MIGEMEAGPGHFPKIYFNWTLEDWWVILTWVACSGCSGSDGYKGPKILRFHRRREKATEVPIAETSPGPPVDKLTFSGGRHCSATREHWGIEWKETLPTLLPGLAQEGGKTLSRNTVISTGGRISAQDKAIYQPWVCGIVREATDHLLPLRGKQKEET